VLTLTSLNDLILNTIHVAFETFISSSQNSENHGALNPLNAANRAKLV
jgi:hypothetical protein